jgi:hypothetical protein
LWVFKAKEGKNEKGEIMKTTKLKFCCYHSFVFVALVFSLGCATSYQEKGFGGGFSETQLSENIWIVNFRGNGYTKKERTVDFSLLRSAELALENGFSYFSITDSNTDVTTGTFTTPRQSYSTGTVQGYGNLATYQGSTQYYGGQTIAVRKPTSSNTVIMFKEKPENTLNAFDAKFIIKSIKRKYDIK